MNKISPYIYFSPYNESPHLLSLICAVTSHKSTAKRVCACDNIFLVNAMGVPIRSAFTCRHIQLQKYCQKGMVCACDNIFLVHAMGVPICSAFTCCHNQLRKYCQKGNLNVCIC